MFFTRPATIYVQISPEQLVLKNVTTGQTIADVPDVALSASPNRKVLATGLAVKQVAVAPDVRVLNPFAHPRSLISDFDAAFLLIKHQLSRVLADSWRAPSPSIVMHPMGSPLGGFTPIECRAFRELGLSLRASKVLLWTGRPLTDQELLSKDPPASAGEWRG